MMNKQMPKGLERGTGLEWPVTQGAITQSLAVTRWVEVFVSFVNYVHT